MKILRLALALVSLLLIVLGVALVATRPEPLTPGTQSARRLQPGPYPVEKAEDVWVDKSRPTAANGDYEGAPTRTFEIALWSPKDAPGPHPLLVYSHGFMSDRNEGKYLAEHLASHGYVVVSASFPLTHFGAPGGPFADDVVNQPADVSFLIDRVLSLSPTERNFYGGIDRDRIAVAGLSLGGLTTTLVAFHPTLGDPRIRAAVSIAGPSAMFSRDYFAFVKVPFLMIAGTHDAMIPYASNGAPIPRLIHDGGLVTIEGASHAGFSAIAAGPMRLLGNPDNVGCESLMANLDLEPGTSPFANLGGPEDGLVDASQTPLPCEIRFDEVMHPGRQHMLTTLSVRAFLESRFAETEEDREKHAKFLAVGLPSEIPDLKFTGPESA